MVHRPVGDPVSASLTPGTHALAVAAVWWQLQGTLGVGAARDLGRDWGAWRPALAGSIGGVVVRAANVEARWQVRALAHAHAVDPGWCTPACDVSSYRGSVDVGPVLARSLTSRLTGVVGVAIGRSFNHTVMSAEVRAQVPSPPADWTLRHDFLALTPGVEWGRGRWRVVAEAQLGRMLDPMVEYSTGLCESAGPPHVPPNPEPCRWHVPSRLWQRVMVSVARR